jgi:NAD(P)-dependent dehydrogenase (short-subunit alcohol dehydrogenase family)
MAGRLEGYSTVVTGGASGMGRSTIELWLEEGANVVCADLNQHNGDALVEEMKAKGFGENRLKFVRTDVSQEGDVVRAIETAIGAWGKLDVMFNNAGIDGAFGPLTEIEVEHWDQTFAITTRGVFIGIKQAARVMQKQEWGGSIINTGSLGSQTAGGGPLCYASAKAAVLRLTQSAAFELGKWRIRVNAILPGIIYTPLMHRGKPERADEVGRPVQPLPFRGEGKHIAQAALFLAGSESEFVSGEYLRVDGGLFSVGPMSFTPMVSPSKKRAGMNFGMTGMEGSVRTLDPID